MTQIEEKKRHWSEEAGYGSFDAMLTIKAPQFELEYRGQHHPLDPYCFGLKGEALPIVRVDAYQMWALGSMPAVERALDGVRQYLEQRRDG